MNTYTTQKHGRRRIPGTIAVLAGSLSLAGLAGAAQAQINRTGPPNTGTSTSNNPVVQQNGVNFNALFPARGYPITPNNPNNGRRPGALGGFSNLPNGFQGLNGLRRGIGPQPNPPGTPLDNLFGGRPGGTQYYAPSRGEDLLFGGSLVVPRNAVQQGTSFNRFRNSQEGRLYYHGYYGPAHHHIYYNWGNVYFPDSWGYYPNYYPGFVSGVTVLSPYAYYYGAFPPFISMDDVSYQPPQYIYVPVPVYDPNGSYQGWKSDDVDNYYLNSDKARNQATDQNGQNYRIGEGGQKAKSPAQAAVDDIQKAWQTGDIEPLAKHIRRDSRIAVYLRGKYQYSLDAGDYLDMTRDAFRSMHTEHFDLDQLHLKQNGIYTVTGRHVYKNDVGQDRTVFISFVLEKTDADNEYVITQVGTSPDQIEE